MALHLRSKIEWKALLDGWFRKTSPSMCRLPRGSSHSSQGNLSFSRIPYTINLIKIMQVNSIFSAWLWQTEHRAYAKQNTREPNQTKPLRNGQSRFECQVFLVPKQKHFYNCLHFCRKFGQHPIPPVSYAIKKETFLNQRTIYQSSKMYLFSVCSLNQYISFETWATKLHYKYPMHITSPHQMRLFQ